MKTLQTRFFLALAFVPAMSGISAFAQTSTVELIGTVPASQVKDGLGFNLHPGNDWEWQAAAAAGATHARFQCGWSVVEKQTAPPQNAAASPRYVEDSNCAAGFVSAKKYGIHPTVVAAFGAPYHPILTVTVPQGASVGATSFEIEYAQGFGGDTLANLKFPYDYICPFASSTNTCASQFSFRHSYQGTLIASVTDIDSTHAKINLASALTQALPANSTPYLVNEILYPSTATESASDPSIVAYGDYVTFLANDMASHGVTGDVELWNEPPWTGDPWDWRAGLYDSGLYTGSTQNPANFGFVANLMNREFPAGVTATWNGTSGSGANSVLGARMQTYTGVAFKEANPVVTKESFHPYSGQFANPEEMMWVSSCLQGTASATAYPFNDPMSNGMKCELPGVANTANMMSAVQYDMEQKLISPLYGVGHEITETNELPPAAGMQLQQSKAVMRQFIGYQADGITPIEFFEMNDVGNSPDPNFSFVQQVGATSNYTANPDYTALADFMQDISPISNAPAVSYAASDLPSILSYTGTYALATANFVGSRNGATANSFAYLVWQSSACTTVTTCWYSLAAPTAAPVTVNIPSGLKVTSIVDTVTRATVSYTLAGEKLTFSASDDPIEVLLDPASNSNATAAASSASGLTVTTSTLATSSSSIVYGKQVTFTATVKPYTAKGHSNNGDVVSFYSGSTLLGTAPLSSGVASFTTTALPSGRNTIGAAFNGDANFFGSTGLTTVVVSSATPVITLPTIASKVTTSAPFTVAATSTSPASMMYSVVSGPARISTISNGTATLAITGAGTVILQASQNPSSNFTSGSAQTSFTVQGAEASGLAFPTIPTQTYGEASLIINATSLSSAPITYSVINGPAKLSGDAVSFTGTGSVILQASQPIGGNYLASTVRTTFYVQGMVPTIKFPVIASKVTTSAPFTVTASSNSSATMMYAVLSGPARLSGTSNGIATLAVTGAGTVILQASQNNSGNYRAGSTQTSFTVQAATASGLAFPSISTQTYGEAPLTINATSLSSAPITYSVIAGPAKLSGNTVSFTGTGSVILQASQPIGGVYLASTVRTTFSVQGMVPTITLPSISTKETSVPFTVKAASNSSASMMYTVVSGPARISGISNGTATLAAYGTGTVVLKASQNPSGDYRSGSTQTSFAVQKQ